MSAESASRSKPVSPQPPFNAAIQGGQTYRAQRVEECTATLPEHPWREYFCQIAVLHHGGKFTQTRFNTDARRRSEFAEKTVLNTTERSHTEKGRSPTEEGRSPTEEGRSPLPRLELSAFLLMRDLDGACIANDPTLTQDMDEWWGNPLQRNKMVSEYGRTDVCTENAGVHARYDNFHILVIDLTEAGVALFQRTNEVPHEGMLFWPAGQTGLWSYRNYPSFPTDSDFATWDTRKVKTKEDPTVAGRNGEAWARSYAEDKFLKGAINMAFFDYLSQISTFVTSPLFPGNPTDKNYTFAQGITVSNNGKYEFGDFGTYGPQWVEYTEGYGLIDLEPDHEYAVVVFGSDGGRELGRKFEVSDELRQDPDDVVAIRRITPEEIKKGGTITMYERPRVKIGPDGKQVPFPPAGAITLNIRR